MPGGVIESPRAGAPSQDPLREASTPPQIPELRLDPRNLQQRFSDQGIGEPTSEGRRPQIDIIAAATTNARRLSLITFLADGVPVIKVPLPDEEPETTKPGKVVRDKLSRGLTIVESLHGENIPSGAKVALIAADTISAPAALDKNGEIIWKHQSKPRKEKDVSRSFRDLEAVARRKDTNTATYAVSTASGILLMGHEQPQPFIPAPLESELELDVDFLEWMNHQGGLEEYKQNVLEFHRSATYTNGGELHAISVMDIAAGFSIPVITKMGGVVSINGVDREDPGFRNEFLRTVYIAGAGIHPDIARIVNPNLDPKTWQFPHRMADYALGEAA